MFGATFTIVMPSWASKRAVDALLLKSGHVGTLTTSMVDGKQRMECAVYNENQENLRKARALLAGLAARPSRPARFAGRPGPCLLSPWRPRCARRASACIGHLGYCCLRSD